MSRHPAAPARLALVLAAALAACATVEGPPPGPSPFRSAKRLVLVRRVDDARPQRGRDPLDALKESLEARGYEARVVEIGPGRPAELRDLEGLEDRIEGRAWTRPRSDGVVDRMGPEAGAIVARLGADAVVGYHRLDGRLAPLSPPPMQPWGSPAPYPAAQPQPAPGRPAGALSLLAADGSLAWFPWGAPGAEMDLRALLNPAEAIDAVLAALAGEAGDGG